MQYQSSITHRNNLAAGAVVSWTRSYVGESNDTSWDVVAYKDGRVFLFDNASGEEIFEEQDSIFTTSIGTAILIPEASELEAYATLDELFEAHPDLAPTRSGLMPQADAPYGDGPVSPQGHPQDMTTVNYDHLVRSLRQTIDFICFTDRPLDAAWWLCARGAVRDAEMLLRERYDRSHIVSLLMYHQFPRG